MKREKAKSDIGAMYERYYGRLMLIACSYTHDKTQAEDLVHEAFLKAILSYHATGSFLSWAARVIRNDWLNKCKHEKFMDDMDIGQLSLPAQEDLLRDYIAGETAAGGYDLISARKIPFCDDRQRISQRGQCPYCRYPWHYRRKCKADQVPRKENAYQDEGGRG